LFILQNYFPEKIEKLVQNQKAICQQWKQEQDSQLENEDDHFQKLLINYRKMQIQSMIEWLDLIE
jgi:hypothetical protein